MTRLLRIEAPHFVAGAIFEKTDATWKCVQVAPIIKYMRAMTPRDISAYIKKKRWSFQWL